MLWNVRRPDADEMYPVLRQNAVVNLDRHSHDDARIKTRDSQFICIARVDRASFVRLIEEVQGTLVLRGLEAHIQLMLLRDWNAVLGIVKYLALAN